ncbi:MAG: hypothetical protein ACR2K3_00030 [Nocardioides sp.]
MSELPKTPLTVAQLIELGYTSQQLTGLVRLGVLTRIFRGVYCRADVPLTIDLRAAALALVLPGHAVVCDHTAAWLLGVDVQPAAGMDGPLDIDVVYVENHYPTERSGVFGGKRDLQDEEIWVVGGVRVTSPARTACDLASRRGRRPALAALDAIMRAFGLTTHDYRKILPRYRGRRGCVQLRELIEYAVPDAESPRESWVRMEIIDAGLPVPKPQVWVDVPGHGRARLDLAYRGRRVGVEYDGEEFHTSEEDKLADKERRGALRDDRWIIIVVGQHDFDGERRDAWLRELAEALAERSPSRPRRYARGERRRPAVPRRKG